MFTITKNARIHESVASEKYSVAEIKAMTKERGSNYYAFPFETPILGCGDNLPDDYDQTKRYKFVVEADYTVEDYIADIRLVVEEHGLKNSVNGHNRGIDLELRAIKRPNPKKSMGLNDKFAYVAANHPTEFMEIQSSTEPAKLVEAIARWFDENVG